MNYQDFIEKKLESLPPSGFNAEIKMGGLFPHQYDLTKWALRRGKAAIFADTGLGKTRIQVKWAESVTNQTKGKILILCPLSVANQTINEAKLLGVKIHHAHENSDIKDGINISNYGRMHKFDASQFIAIILDESSIIKHHDSKTLRYLLTEFAKVPYKLCLTATPSPNDFTELGTHAEFLGVMTQSEMLSEFFIHDGGETQKWRLKGHAKHEFWRWVSSWGAMVKSPSDLGHDASLYNLPPIEIMQHTVITELRQGQIFAKEAQTLTDRRNARRDSIGDRVKLCAEIVNKSTDIWIIWCELNSEGDELKKAIPGSVEIRGSDLENIKEKNLDDFADGKIRVLITKPKIAGFGLNWQHCHHMAFVGVTDSFEAYYQSVRRCWRFGQKNIVNVHLIVSDTEGAVANNLKRKEQDAKTMADSLILEVIESVKNNVVGFKKEVNQYNSDKKITIPKFIGVINNECN
jgi:hypothetical protein